MESHLTAVSWPRQEETTYYQPPMVFMRELKQRVVGQRELVVKLAHAFSHYTAFLDDPQVGKPLPLIYGPSGAGKTYSIELCCEISGLDLTTVGGGGVSPAGYKGTTMRDLITQHFVRHGRSEGVIFVDEVDKWTRGAIAQHEKPDPEAVAVGLSKQNEALRYVEREMVDFIDEGKDIDEVKGRSFDTGQTFWIFAGAFVGLDRMIRQRTGQEQIASEDIWENAEPVDFIRYGLTEEFANRIMVWAWARPIKAAEMQRILQEQDVPRWERLFGMMGCHLELDGSALASAVHAAVSGQRGVRGAKMYLNRVLGDVYTEAGERELTRVRVDGPVMLSGHLEL